MTKTFRIHGAKLAHAYGKHYVTGSHAEGYEPRILDIVRFKVYKKTDGRAHSNYGRIISISAARVTITVASPDGVELIKRKPSNVIWIASVTYRPDSYSHLPTVDMDEVLEAAGARNDITFS